MLILFIVLLLGIPFALSLFAKRQVSQQKVSTTPLPTHVEKPEQPTSLPTVFTTVVPTISPTEDPQTKLLSIIQNRPALSLQDLSVKDKIVSTLPQGQYSGTVYQTPDFAINYVQGPDLFQVEIETGNIEQARTEATNWFIAQGMSKQGVCDLPVEFFLSNTIKNQTTTQSPFNPLPDGC